MSDNAAFLVTVAGLLVAWWAWPVLVEVRGLLVAWLRTRRHRLEERGPDWTAVVRHANEARDRADRGGRSW